MLSAVLCAVALGQVVLGEGPQVTTSQGRMRGQVLKSRGGREYFSFTKIPYAKPPLGELRFVISEKAGNWSGIWDATQPTPSCYQIGSAPGDPEISGQEDCLYLDVFTPNITGRIPVTIFIFGGAFKNGSVSYFNSANFFMDEDIVFVAPNYRLGTLGFISFEDDIIPGNMGLKDLALALEWVYNEISAFGGDPNLITVYGGSSGSVCSHIICEAPRTNSLIKGCINVAGDGWAPWAFMEKGEARKLAMKFAEDVGCNETGNLLLQCLQSKPIQLDGDIRLLQNSIPSLRLLAPVLEPDTAPGAMVTSWPTNAKHDYPRIIGLNENDGSAITYNYQAHVKSEQETEEYINSFNETIIKEFHLENRESDFLRIWQRFFLEGIEPLIAIRNLVTEYLWVYPAMKSLSMHLGPTYLFKFNYTRGPQGHVDPSTQQRGAIHGGEGPYLGFHYHDFDTSNDNSSSPWPNDEDMKMSELLIKMFVNFVWNQSPGIVGTVEWPPFQGQYFLDIEDSGISVGNFTQYHEILDFWDGIISGQTANSSTIQ